VILTPYGKREWIAASAVLAVAAALAAWWFWPVAVLPAALWAWVLWFFRDPVRAGPSSPGLLLSPADGRVSDITPVGADSELGAEGLRVGIFMNILNVHVNRSPARARVESVSHRKGSFLDARDALAGERNESATIRLLCRLNGREEPILVRQVAGLIARRIVTDLSPGQELSAGQRIGMIKFGSRLELLVPHELVGQVRVQVGQKVRAGQTVLIAAPGAHADEHV
jgi:phosphatidylserine decarboxylase